MKKLGFLLFVPLLVFTALLAVNTEDGTKATIPKHEATVLAAEVPSMEAADVEQARSLFAWKSVFQRERQSSEVAVSSRQENLLRLQSQMRAPDRKATASGNFLGSRSIRPTGESGLLETLGVGSIGVVIKNIADEVITSYTIGDTIIIVITYGDTVWLEPYIDDGDGEFDPLADLYFAPTDGDDGDEEIIIVDGDEDDEDPTTGVWQITFDTGDVEEGAELFGLQGARLFLSLSNSGGTDTGLATLDALPPATMTSVSGNVSLYDESAAPNVIVVAFPWQEMMDEGQPEGMALTMTGADGNYTLTIEDDVADADFQIMAFDFFGLFPGLFPDPQVVETYISPGDELFNVDFVLSEATATISGTLTDEDGTAIPGIRIFANNGPYNVEATTDPSGDYSIPVVPGWWRVNPSDDDLIGGGFMVPRDQDDWVEVSDVAPTVVDFVAHSTDVTISGTVLWSDSSPAEGAEIWCDTPAGFFTRAETGPTGTYLLNVSSVLDSIEIMDEMGGTWTSIGYWVGVWAEEALSQPDGAQARAGDTGIDFTLYHADVFLSGHIYDEFSDPLRDAGIHAFTIDSEDGFSTGTGSWEEGYYELPLLSGYTWVIEVFHPYMWGPPAVTDTLVSPASGSSPVRDYYLPAPATHVAVEGYVFDDMGISLANARVEIIQTNDGDFYAETFTDGDGYFRIEGVPAFGEFDVVASVRDRPPQHQHIWTGDEDVYVEFWLGDVSRFRVDGTIMDESGMPIPGGVVLVFAPTVEEPIDGYFLGDDGYYEFFLKPGVHTIQAGATGFQVGAQEVDVQSDSTIDLTLISAEGLLTAHAYGRVKDPEEYGLSYVFVGFISDGYMGFTNTDYDGNYGLDLIPGEYLTFYQKPGYDEVYIPSQTINTGDNPLPDVIMVPEAFLELVAVGDVPNDHGKKVHLTWEVNPEVSGMFTRFIVWEIGSGSGEPDPYNPEVGPPPRHVGTVPVHPGFVEYGFVARTLHDEVQTWYMVTAHGYDLWEFWDSNFMSGISLDNLAPAVPSGMIVSGGATDLDVNLTWDPSIDDPVEETPVQYYTIYRGGETGDLALLDYAAEPSFSDVLPEYGTYRYAVSATDFAGNESARSEEETYTIILSVVDGIELPDKYALGANYPNPFNPSTTITYQLPEAGHVTLQVYDLTGKVVNTLVSDYRPAGYHQVVWNGRDSKASPVATGVYFYRITAGQTYAETRKMVLMK